MRIRININNFSNNELTELGVDKTLISDEIAIVSQASWTKNTKLVEKVISNLDLYSDQEFSDINFSLTNVKKSFEKLLDQFEFDCYTLHFTDCNIANIDFNDFNLNFTSFTNCEINDCSFECCSLQDTSFNDCLIYNSEFIDSEFVAAAFNNSKMKFVKFLSCDMNGVEINKTDIIKSQIIDCDIEEEILNKFDYSEPEKENKMRKDHSDSDDVLLSGKDIVIYSAATPAIVEMATICLKKLVVAAIRKLGTESGKTARTVNSYIIVIHDLMESHKEETKAIVQLMIGYVAKNLESVADWAKISQKDFMKFINMETLTKFGTFAFANAEGILAADMLKKATSWLMTHFMGSGEALALAGAMANPESAPDLMKQMREEEKKSLDLSALLMEEPHKEKEIVRVTKADKKK